MRKTKSMSESNAQRAELQKTFAQVYDEHVDSVYRFVYFKVSDEYHAQDLTSDIFLKYWDAFSSNDKNIAQPRAFIFRIARNTIIDFYRRKKITVDIDSIGDAEYSKDTHGMEHVEAFVEYEKIKVHLDKLKDEYKEVLLLKHIEELSIKEIATVLDKSQGATRVLLHRALASLRALLDEHSYEN